MSNKIPCLPIEYIFKEEFLKRANKKAKQIMRRLKMWSLNEFHIRPVVYKDGLLHFSYVINDKWRIQFDYIEVSVKKWSNRPFFDILPVIGVVNRDVIKKIIVCGVFSRLNIAEYNTCTEQVLRITLRLINSNKLNLQ